MKTQTLSPYRAATASSPVLKMLTRLLFVWMLVIGIVKLVGTQPALVDTFRAMHYLDLMPFVGILEIAGGVGLLLPKWRIWAASALFLLFFGGLASHLASATYLPMAPLSVVALLMAACIIRFDGRLRVG